MSFLRKNQERIKATRAFCEAFFLQLDPFQEVLNSMNSLDTRIAWAIAGEALHQSISLGQLGDLVSSLHDEFPENRLWILPALRVGDVERVIKGKPWLNGWALEPHIAGILNSVGHWIRSNGGLPTKAIEGKNTAQLWKQLGSLYFMGKTNPIKPKALAVIQRLKENAPRGLGIPIEVTSLASGNSWPWPVSVGARKWLKIIGPNPQSWMGSHGESERLQYFQKMFKAIYPENPELVVHGLSFFLESGGSDFLCRTMLDGCRHCPLASMSILSGNCPQRRV